MSFKAQTDCGEEVWNENMEKISYLAYEDQCSPANQRVPLINDIKKAADNNLVTALNNSTFTLKEKIAFFKKKWLREHIATIVLCIVVWIGIMLWVALNNSYALLGAIGSILAILFYVVLYNRMMAYVENNAYRDT